MNIFGNKYLSYLTSNVSKKFLLSIFIFSFLSCGGGGGSDSQSDSSVFAAKQKSYLYSLFKTEYLWADEVKYKNYSNFTDPQEMIDAFRHEKDRWSYYNTLEEYNDAKNQRTKGFGCYTSNRQIYKVRFDSPCERAGFKRGDIIVKINGQDVANSFEKYKKAYRKAQNNMGVKSTIGVMRGDQLIHIDIIPQFYKFKNTKYQIIVLKDGTKIAHLIYDSFTEASLDQIYEAFVFFKENDVDELVVDLRYNGGGNLAVSSILLDYIAGLKNDGRVQSYFKWNSNYSQNNDEFLFEREDNSLDLKRIFFLVTEDTASASEITINALKPYMDVILIGSPTHGKPVGMGGKRDNNLIYWLINYKVYNANMEGDYFDGLSVDCQEKDEYDYPRISSKDNLFQTALYYIITGRCY